MYTAEPMGKPHHRWIVVETKHSAEREAARNARAQDFETYTPLFRKSRRNGVREIHHLFSPYIFVCVKRDQRWQALCSTRGVKSVIMNDDKPSHVLDSDIQAIRALENEMGYVVIEDQEPPALQLQQFVYPTAGCWSGQQGVYFGQTSRSRSKVVFEMMGRAIAAEVLTRDLAIA